jgi:hypothetical protein
MSSVDPDPWLSTASGPRPGNGAPGTITWSFVPDSTRVTRLSGSGTSASNLISFLNTNFGGNPAQTDLSQQPWFHLFDDSFGRWEELSGVNFVYEPEDDGVTHPSQNGVLDVRGDIRLGGYNVDGDSGTLAFTYLPTSGSDMVIDTGDDNFFSEGTTNFINLRNTLMHEIGHSFGLLHVESTSSLLMEPFIDTSFDGPQLDEVRGVQFFFGDANEKSNGGLGNGTAALATDLGTIAAGSMVHIGSDAVAPGQAISAAATDFVSIANLSDVDFYRFTVLQPSLVSATLTPRGGVFTQASEGLPPTSFDANARNNLALSLFDDDGASVLATAAANPAGAAELLADVFVPAGGAYYAEISGADDTIQLYDLLLSITPLVTGDYNRDGTVNAADYTVWRNTRGQTGVSLAADGDGDNAITELDYDIWKSHYGNVAAGAGQSASSSRHENVPEPSAALLIIAGALLLPVHFDRRLARRTGLVQ